MSDVTLVNVGKTYAGNVTAVGDANIDIKQGEFIVLVGPSGCGKSTILRMIAGLETVTDGEIRIGDKVVNNVEPGDRNIAMVFQNYALYPHMSVRQNMAYGLKNQGMARAEIDKRIADAASILQLDRFLDRKPRQLSGGQRQRVAMGRAIVREPAVFLFDEPLSNLDAKLRTQLRAELKDLHTRLNTTFVFVTHDQVEAMSLADRIVIMSEGRVEQIGTPMELYHSPASRFVAEFIGSPPMNVFDKNSAAGAVLVGLAQSCPDNTAFVGARPEDIKIAQTGPEAKVALTESLGAETLLHLRIGDDRVILRTSAENAADHVGQSLSLAVDPKDIVCFDSDGKTIT
jgi:sn-glycerol 3-phosphate transport system ATP-binding protein